MLLKASCRWFGAAAIIPAKTVPAGSARAGAYLVASAFIRDAAGLAYIDDQGRLFPLLEVDEDDEEPVLFESEQIWFSKNPDGHYVIASLDGSIALRFAPLVVAEDGSDEDSTLFPLVAVEDANGNHQRFVYHSLAGLPQYVIDGNGRVFSLNFGNVADEQYHYDYNNELTKRVFADDNTNLMERDGLGRLLSHTDALGQHTDTTTRPNRVRVYDAGKIIGASDGVDTPYIRAECSQGGGVIHRHPITKRRTLDEIRGKLKWNMTLILKMALLLMKIYFGYLITLMN